MTDAGAPRRGRHASPDTDASGVPIPWAPSSTRQPVYDRDPWAGDLASWDSEFDPSVRRPAGPRGRDEDPAARTPTRYRRRSDVFAAASTGGARRVSPFGDRSAEETGPLPAEWRHRGGDADGPETTPGTDVPASWGGPADRESGGPHPSAPLPPLPGSGWSRLDRRPGAADDVATQAQPAVLPPPPPADDADTDAHVLDPRGWAEQTGGLDVIGANVDDDAPRRGRWRRRGAPHPEGPAAGGEHLPTEDADDEDRYDEDLHEEEFRGEGVHDDRFHDEEFHDEDLHDVVLRADDDHDGPRDEDIPLKPYDPRTGRRRRRRRRRPLAVLVALVVLAGLVGGVVVGGQKLLGLFVAEDYTGEGTGSVDIRIQNGDTLSDIARTLVDADVVASVGPFVDAADAEPAARGINPGVYRMHEQMSGAAALKLLLDPASRLVSRVTIPEGLTMANTLQRIADATSMPIADLQAAAANPAALGLPAYANGSLEGFLFPATYDVEPGDTPAAVLTKMVARSTQALDQLGVPQDQRLRVVTEASLVQAEASTPADMAKVAQVLNNRLAIAMPLQLDTTVNYANGKSGITTTAADRANPSPYNTYLHPGLPPGPIGNPGEDALHAVLNPTPGDWLYFVVVDPDNHDTRFAVTAQEHAANVALFQQWLRAHPGG